MPISYVAAGAVSTGTNPVVAVPAGIQQNDLLVLAVSIGAAVAPTTPAGWTAVGSTTTTPRIYIYRKFAAATESSLTLTVASTTVQAVMLAYRGVSATDTVATFSSATSTTIATNTLSTTYINEYVVSVYAMTTGDATWTAPGSTTERVNAAGTAALSGLLVVDEFKAAAGTSTARTATSSVSKALSAGAFSIISGDRYWVGGSGNWDGTAGTKWAFSSGGAGGAPVPNSTSNVFFDSNSGASTITVSAGNTGAQSITCTGFTGTLAGSTALSVNGGITLVAGMTYTYSGTLTITGTGTLTTASKTLNAVTINGVGITVTLGDALNIGTNNLTLTQGTFTTNNFNVTAAALVSTANNPRTINLGSSTVTLSLNQPISFANATLTFNAGTSEIVLTANVTSFIPSNFDITFYNVSFTDTSTAVRQFNYTVVNTFNRVTFSAPAATGVTEVAFYGRNTFNNGLATFNTAGNRRILFRGETYGLAQTLTINGAGSLTDADFRDIYVIGSAGSITGTRIGNLGGCSGITFSTPKTVYWNLAGAQNWSATGWATTSTGTPSNDNFPLAQDTATFTNAGAVTGTITMDSAIPYTGTVDMSGRSSAMTLSIGAARTVYGDWKNGSGVSLSGSSAITFSKRGTQVITSAGKTFPGNITVDAYGGTVELADAFNIGTRTLTITNGTFDSKSFNVTIGSLSSTNSNVRGITLGSSYVTVQNSSTPWNCSTSTNLTVNAGTSTIDLQSSSSTTFEGGSQTYSLVQFTGAGSTTYSVGGNNTFANLRLGSPSATGYARYVFSGNQTVTSQFRARGNSAIQRVYVQADNQGVTRTITAASIDSIDCDFRDITIAGAAAGTSITRAGNCGGNSGITFPVAKTVYWNLAGTQNWSATGWATSSGGTPAVNNFPLAQDTVVFDNTGAVGTVTANASWNFGTLNASARTSAMTLAFTGGSNMTVHGNWTFGSGVTMTTSGAYVIFAGRTTQTITSNGRQFTGPIQVESLNGTVVLADAFTGDASGAGYYLNINRGTFDAATYNVTIFGATDGLSSLGTLKMGSGLWTLTGAGTIWDFLAGGSTLEKGTANILLSNTTALERIFNGNGFSYNKLTIGGATGSSQLTINGDNQFTELASTKTVAHTIALGSTTQTFGKWTVTGASTRVVTLTGSGTSHILAGSCTSGIDYLAMGSIGFAATSPGEFYAGVNSTGTAGAPVYRTAKPADSTRYWVGGTGNWSDTNRWSTSSGGSGGASVPRSHDDVVFDAASNATAYTATIDAVTGGVRFKALTIAGPASGNVTLAGSTNIVGAHGNITLPATGLTRNYTGQITLSGSSAGKTLTTNGVALAANMTVNGVDCGWVLGSELTLTNSRLTVTNGSIDLSTYNLTINDILSTSRHSRTIALGSSTVTLTGSNPIDFQNTANLTFNGGTSTINVSGFGSTIRAGGVTFYNVTFSASSYTWLLVNAATYNNLTFNGRTSGPGLNSVQVYATQTVNGTLTFTAGTDPAYRTFIRSDTFATTRTLSVAAFSGTDVDFLDMAVTGAAAPISGTRLGDCKGNSGITFPAGKTVYVRSTGSASWSSSTGWSATSGGAADSTQFPLAQDTVIFPAATYPASGSTITYDASYNVGTIDMSLRTSNTVVLAISSAPTVYLNWINGTGSSVTGLSSIVYAGRGSQTITSAGVTFTPGIQVNSPSGTVTLQDAYTCSGSSSFITILRGTFNAATYNVTMSGVSSAVSSSNANTRTIGIGSGTWTLAGSGSVWDTSTSTNLTVTGTGTISLTSASAKTFAGGGIAYTNITLNQGGNGTLTISGNNTFKTISSTAPGASAINIDTTTQRITTSWTAAGTAGNLLTVQGTSPVSPGTLVFTGAGTAANVDYLIVTGIRAYNLTATWDTGANSINNGSLGWIFAIPPIPVTTGGKFFLLFG